MNIKRYIAAIAVVSIALVMLAMPTAATVVAPPGGSVNGQFTAVTIPTITATASGSSVYCTPNGVSTFTLTATVTDANGAAASDQVNAQLYNGATALGAPIVVTGGTGTGNTATFTVGIPFQYTYPAGSGYSVVLTASNPQKTSAPYTFSPINYVAALGISIDSGSSLNFGTLGLGDTSATQTTTVHNTVNQAENVGISANPWTSSVSGAAPVPASSLSSNNPSPLSIDAHAPIGFVETVPTGISPYAGTYTTTITLTASAA
jgi:hypothetical protein